jgi:hypothetical protein
MAFAACQHFLGRSADLLQRGGHRLELVHVRRVVGGSVNQHDRHVDFFARRAGEIFASASMSLPTVRFQKRSMRSDSPCLTIGLAHQRHVVHAHVADRALLYIPGLRMGCIIAE